IDMPNNTNTYYCNFKVIVIFNPSLICILLYILLGSLSIVTVCGNLLVIISIIYFKQLHIPTNYLILSLAVADVLVGILVFPCNMAFTVTQCWYYEDLFCKVRGSFDVTLSTASILNLSCISVDRYFAVCQPLTYKSKITHRVVVAMILASWGVAALIGIGLIAAGFSKKKCVDSCPFHVKITPTFVCIGSFYLPASIMLCIYLKILQVAQKQAHRIQNTASGATVSKVERKATKTLATVMGVFLVCWTPFFLCLTFQPVSNYAIPVFVIEAFSWLGRSNSMLNPFVYAFFYNWFRVAFRMIISGKIYQGDFGNLKEGGNHEHS
uniref:Muscarinic acetylcholine receptor n=1 Tax=Monopterus albus TaxID=43700 RepID=A0A3Q3K9D7_MONAL